MADEKIEIELILDGKRYTQSLSEAVKESDKKGKEAGKSFGSGFSSNVKAALQISGVVAGVVAAVQAARRAIGTATETIRLAGQQEEAINRLNIALRSSGSFSQAASKDLQDFATQLQSVSRFGDEVILDQLALAKSFGATNDQAKLVAQASADLAAELGVSLETATRNVAKTLGGYAGELGETIPALKNFTQEQLKAGEGIDFIAKRFAGGALRSIQTYDGATEQLSNTWGDFLEEIGKFVTQSPSVRAAISEISRGIADLTGLIKDGRQDDFFRPLLLGAIGVVRFFNDFVLPTFNKFISIIKLVGFTVTTTISGALLLAVQKLRPLSSLLEKLGFDSASKAIDEFVQGRVDTFERTTKGLNDAFNGLFSDESFSEDLAKRLDEAQVAILTANDNLGEALRENGNNFNLNDLITGGQEDDDFTAGIEEKLLGVGDQFTLFFEGFKSQIDDWRKTSVAAFIEVGRRAANIFAAGIGNAFSRVGQALANGSNAFQAFGQAFMGIFGDIASAAGDVFIKLGIANIAAGNVGQGSAELAAGAALKVLGGFLTAKAGGSTPLGVGGAGAGGGVGAGAGGVDSPVGDVTDDQLEAVRQGQVVNVNVEGSIFDSQDTAQRLADLINEANEEGDVTLNPTVVRA